jgi:conjugal transfer pilus assembly protein TraV
MTPLLVASALAGCASGMSGLDSQSGYGCRAPTGSQCTSVSGVYANSTAPAEPKAHPAPSPAAPPRPVPDTVPSESVPTGAAVYTPAVGADTASIRLPPRILRLWIAPWEDADGDLHEASHVHVIVNAGRWRIDQRAPASASRTAGTP